MSVSRTDLFEFQFGIHFYSGYKICKGNFEVKILIQLNSFSVKNNYFSGTSVNFFTLSQHKLKLEFGFYVKLVVHFMTYRINGIFFFFPYYLGNTRKEPESDCDYQILNSHLGSWEQQQIQLSQKLMQFCQDSRRVKTQNQKRNVMKNKRTLLSAFPPFLLNPGIIHQECNQTIMSK